VVAIPVVGSAEDVHLDALAAETANDGVFTFPRDVLPGSIEVVADDALL